MRIEKLSAVPAFGSYYCEDVTGLQSYPVPLSERYRTPSKTPSFKYLREPGEAVSVGLRLEDGQIAWGDCVSVAYAGKAGRDAVFRTSLGLEQIREVVAPALEGKTLTSFRELARELRTPKLHTAVRYGVTQAILQAVALRDRCTMTEVICREWDLPLPGSPIPLHAQSGTNRYDAADKMIVRRLASLPHGLVDDIPEQLGERGEKLVEYADWLSRRIRELGEPGYAPTIHLDVHGAIGKLLHHDLDRIVGLLKELEAAAKPFPLRMESVVVAETRSAQIEMTKELMKRLEGSSVQIVVDEWANSREDIEAFALARAGHFIQVKTPDLGGIDESIDAVLACLANGVGAFLGGTCNETDLSARACAHVALATRPSVILAKPGMGVDEGIIIMTNEMNRALWTLKTQRGADPHGPTPHP